MCTSTRKFPIRLGVFGVNGGRIAEAVMAVRAAVGMPEVRRKPKPSEAVLAPSKLV